MIYKNFIENLEATTSNSFSLDQVKVKQKNAIKIS